MSECPLRAERGEDCRENNSGTSESMVRRSGQLSRSHAGTIRTWALRTAVLVSTDDCFFLLRVIRNFFPLELLTSVFPSL